MYFFAPHRLKKVVIKFLMVVCVLSLSANAIALASFDHGSFSKSALETPSSQTDNDRSKLVHDSHQCNHSKTVTPRDNGSRIYIQTNKSITFDKSRDIVVGQFSPPPLRPPKS